MDEPNKLWLKDPRAMRALAHPLRLRLLGELRREGPATATMLSPRLDEPVPLLSYHLRKLAEHGFIEPAPERARNARERWWQAAHDVTTFSATEFMDTPERWAALSALEREILRIYVEDLEQWLREQPAWDAAWVDAAESSDVVLDLTVTELRQLRDEMDALVERWSRARPSHERGLDREQVRVIWHAFPRRRTSS